MYRVALLQNQSEAFELSYGDVYSWFDASYGEYTWDLFSTEDSMPALFDRMEALYYDAVVFTTNTFNDIYLQRAWTDKSDLVQRYLDNERGLLILQQIKLIDAAIPMLPDPLSLSIVERPSGAAEAPSLGDLVVGDDHPLLHYPLELSIADMLQACHDSHTVEYVYWSLLRPDRPEEWQQVLIDDSYPHGGGRPLLLASGPQSRGRLVVTALVLDWQRQLAPLRNILTYVVEGNHSTAVVRRRAKTSYDFEYLIENLRIAKHAFREYELQTLDFSTLHDATHDVVILDPAWAPSEVTRDRLHQFRQVAKPHARLIYFDTESLGEPAITAVGGVVPLTERHQQALTYVKDAFDRDVGRWDGSYFSTVHVLEKLQTMNEPVSEYRDAFLRSIERHDKDGSYDEQFATTCALLKVYHWFLGNDDWRFQRTVEWLRQDMEAKQARNPGDFARAYLALKECGVPVPSDSVRRLAGNVAAGSIASEDEIIRFIALYTAYELHDEAAPWVSRLVELQRQDGSWGSEERNRLFLTALAADLLLGARGDREGTPAAAGLDESILAAAIHLKAVDLLAVSPRDRAATIAAVLVAVQHFEERITFPIDTFLVEQQIIAQEVRATETFEVASRLISKLQTAKASATDEAAQVEGRLDASRRLANRIAYASLVLGAGLLMSAYVLVQGTLDRGFAETFRPLGELSLQTVGVLVLVGLIAIGLMERKRLVPDAVKRRLGGLIEFVRAPAAAFEGRDRKPRNEEAGQQEGDRQPKADKVPDRQPKAEKVP